MALKLPELARVPFVSIIPTKKKYLNANNTTMEKVLELKKKMNQQGPLYMHLK